MTDDRDVALPIHRSATYRLDDEAYDALDDDRPRDALVYTRWRNPTNEAVALEIAHREGLDDGLVTASGMAAISSTLLGLLPEGGTVAATPTLYGGTRSLLDGELPRFGFDVRYADVGDGLAEAARDADVVYTEPLTNPLVRVVDLPEVARIADDAGADLVVDNTFATPALLNPADHGADVVVHSATKYLGGHSDVVAGAVAADTEHVDAIWPTYTHLGACLDPDAAARVDRGLKTLDVRMERHCSNARAVAEHLADHPDVDAVHHPSLPSHPDHGRASDLLVDYGGMAAFDVGGHDRARQVVSNLDVFIEASSLGGVESLVSIPVDTSHRNVPAKEREALGITPGLVRLSVGIEPVDELIADLDEALG